MNLMPQLLNICKYSGIKFRIPTTHRIEVRLFAANSVEGSSGSSGPSKVDKLKINNEIDMTKFQLIYKPPNNGLLQTATSFCAFSSFACPISLGMYLYDSVYDRNSDLVEQVTTLQLSAMGCASILSTIALFICYKIPMRIYNHQTEYIAILPSFIPTSNRKFYFEKGDIVDKKVSKRKNKFLEKMLKPGFETVSFYKIKDKRLLLTIKCFQKPIQFFEMFANTEKYIRKIKKQR